MQLWTPCPTALKGGNFFRSAPVCFCMHLKESQLNLQMALCLPAFLPSGLSVFISTRVQGKPGSTLQSWNSDSAPGSSRKFLKVCQGHALPTLHIHDLPVLPSLLSSRVPKKQNPPFLPLSAGQRKDRELRIPPLASPSLVPANICTIIPVSFLNSGSSGWTGGFRGGFPNILYSDCPAWLLAEG